MRTKVARRGFLKLMGGAAVGGKQTVQAAVEQAGLSMGLGRGHGDPGIERAVGSDPRRDRRKLMWQKLLNNGLPQWKLDEIRQDNLTVRSLDADIASFRSFSLVAKVGLQRERQVAASIDYLQRYWGENPEEADFLKRNGLDYF